MPALYDIQPAPRTLTSHARISKLPILILAVHTSCNCRCVMCDIWKNGSVETLHAAALDRHRESILALGVERVVLTGGEPLLNREIQQISLFFRDLGIRTTLLTTGLLLLAKAAVIASSFDDVILSIDGPPEVHDRVRRIPGAFALIHRGVAAIRAIKPGMHLSCRTTLQKFNHNHLRSTVAAAKLLQLDSISFLPVDVSTEAFNRPQPWTDDRKDDVALTHDELCELEHEVELLIQTHQPEIRSGFIAESESKLRRLAQRFRERIENIAPTAPLCNAPWVSSVIETDGTIKPCFFHPPIGSLKHQTIQQALNSEAALTFRSTLNVATNPICRQCVCSLNYKS